MVSARRSRKNPTSARAPAAIGQARLPGVHGPCRWSIASANGRIAAVVTSSTQNMITAGFVRVRVACWVKTLANAHENAVIRPNRTTMRG